MTQDTVHFTIGEGLGITLQTIAYEHFVYDHNIDKALNAVNLGDGCDETMQMRLLTGELIILVNVETQEFNVVERSKHPELEDIYPKLDFVDFFTKKQKEIDKMAKSLGDGLDSIEKHFRLKSNYKMILKPKTIIDYIYGKEEETIRDITDELNADDELQHMAITIKLTKTFIEKTVNLKNLAKNIETRFFPGQILFHDTTELMLLIAKMQSVATGKFRIGGYYEADVDEYINNMGAIDKKLAEGISPVNILDNYSAGWLSPAGDYYALNGVIANMLHNRIADALQENDIIPKGDNPDRWLESNGWVKIHGNWILYAGSLNYKLDKDNIYMTKIQKDMITEYIEDCHACTVKLGYAQKKFSSGMFVIMDKIILHKHFDI